MKVLENKFFAAVIMALTTFVVIVPIGHAPIGTALTTILVMLVVFVLIDIAAASLSKAKGKLMSTIIAVVAIVAIGLSSNFLDTVNHKGTNEVSSSSTIETEAETKKTDTAYELGMSYYEMGEYEKAINTLREVDNSSDYYVEAQTTLANARDKYRTQLIDTAKRYVEKNDYDLAFEILNAGILVIPQDEELASTISKYTLAHTSAIRATAIESAEALAAEGDYANAFLSIREAIGVIDGDVELEALSNKYAADYRNDILTQSEVLLHSEGYEAATQLIQSAMTVLPGDKELANALEEYEEYAPVYLIEDIDYLQIDDFWELVMDNDGLIDKNDRRAFGHYYFFHNHGNSSGNITFDLSENYRSFWGTVVLPEIYKHTSSNIYIYVYGDGKLLYKSPNMTAGFQTEDFSIDVIGVSVLMIEFENSIGDGPMDLAKGYLTNAYLSKLEIDG